MQVVELVQGTPEWLEHRKKFFNASDAPAMLAISPYKTRAAYIQERRTGIAPDVPIAVQARFDEGHRVEELARAWAEAEILGEELSPLVGVEGELSASFDGITFDGTIIFEHKLLNDSIRKALPVKGENSLEDLPEHYKAQMEQQLMVSGAKKCLFMASAWTQARKLIDERHGWYESNPAMRQRIVSGWQQMRQTLACEAELEEPAKIIKASAKSTKKQVNLPVPQVSFSGALTSTSNLAPFEERLGEFIRNIPNPPQTDDDFFTCAKAAKVLKDVEEALKQTLIDSLSRVEGVSELRDQITALITQARDMRLVCEKAVDGENHYRKTEKIKETKYEWESYISKLQEKLKRSGFTLTIDAPDFEGSIKRLSSARSVENKLEEVLLQAQCDADTIAKRVATNFKVLDEHSDLSFLFPDSHALAYQQTDDLQREIEQRISAYKQHINESGGVSSVSDCYADLMRPSTGKASATKTQSKRKRSESDKAGTTMVGLKYLKTMLYPLFLNKKHINHIYGVQQEDSLSRDAQWSVESTIKLINAIIARLMALRNKLENDPEWVKTVPPFPTQKERKEAKDRAKAKKGKSDGGMELLSLGDDE